MYVVRDLATLVDGYNQIASGQIVVSIEISSRLVTAHASCLLDNSKRANFNTLLAALTTAYEK